MYYLDFATIIRLLKEFRRSGILQAELPKGIANIQETCQLQLKLLQGEITDCQIMASRGGPIVVDENMFREVERLGPLEWTFAPLKGSSTSSKEAPDNSSSPLPISVPIPPSPSTYLLPPNRLSSSFLALVPCRLTNGKQYSSSTLTRQQIRVLALVNGRRNIGQIAALLFSSSNIESGAQEVLIVLQELEALRIITRR